MTCVNNCYLCRWERSIADDTQKGRYASFTFCKPVQAQAKALTAQLCAFSCINEPARIGQCASGLPPEGRLCSQDLAWCSSKVCCAPKGVTVKGTARTLDSGGPPDGCCCEAKCRCAIAGAVLLRSALAAPQTSSWWIRHRVAARLSHSAGATAGAAGLSCSMRYSSMAPSTPSNYRRNVFITAAPHQQRLCAVRYDRLRAVQRTRELAIDASSSAVHASSKFMPAYLPAQVELVSNFINSSYSATSSAELPKAHHALVSYLVPLPNMRTSAKCSFCVLRDQWNEITERDTLLTARQGDM